MEAMDRERLPSPGAAQQGRRMAMAYTCAVFDLDGTILDTLDDLNDALNRTLDAFGMPQVTRARTRSLVG
ncbi:MAG: HAD hydrolase-like protein, partial [Atopobiaceae bacterium]|nr:HAD hydrolase-like protein [Atopobiaceae bacterium]